MASAPISRREFLRTGGRVAVAAGLAAQVGWLDACTRRPAPDSTDWDGLARSLNGRLLRPGDAGYAAARLPFNRRYANVRPAGIAQVTGAKDVQAAILWARDNGVAVVPRAGGHSYAGYSTTPGLLVDVGGIRSVKVDQSSGSVAVAAGARNTDIYNGLQPHGMAFSAGRCPTVAVSGLTMGGGFGFSSRKLGLTCDALREVQVVTADGRILTCSERQHPDLFWALRGGGGGTFAVTTAFRFQAQDVGDVSIYQLEWDWKDAGDAMAVMQQVVRNAPEEFSCRLGAGIAGPPPGPGSAGTTVTTLGQFFGPKEQLLEILHPALISPKPAKTFVAERTFWQAKNFFFDTTPIDEFQEKSSYLAEPLPDRAIGTLLDHIERWPGSSNAEGAGIAMFAWGGAIGRVPHAATAFVHRDAEFLLAFSTTWTGADSETVSRAGLDWMESLYESMQPFVMRQGYQNFIDPSLKDWRGQYYGANFDRLVRTKRSYDPDDVFHFAQSIPTSA